MLNLSDFTFHIKTLENDEVTRKRRLVFFGAVKQNPAGDFFERRDIYVLAL